jgi:hypothetical protein
MIKNCFITDDLYNYDIEYKGEVIAKAHTLTYREKMRHIRAQAGDLMSFDPIPLIVAALDSWTLGKDITEDNVDKLNPAIINALTEAISRHETEVMQTAGEIEKNL